MSIDQDIAILEQVPMLRLLGRATLKLIALGAETRELQTGEMLFPPGQKSDCAYIVQRGTFRLGADPEQPGRILDAGPGMMLGEFALVSDATRPLTAVAREPATVMRISRSMFRKILEDDAQAAVRLRDYVAQRARDGIADMLAVRDALGEKG